MDHNHDGDPGHPVHILHDYYISPTPPEDPTSVYGLSSLLILQCERSRIRCRIRDLAVDPQVRITASELPWGMRPRTVAVVVCEFVPETGHRDVRDVLALSTAYPFLYPRRRSGIETPPPITMAPSPRAQPHKGFPPPFPRTAFSQVDGSHDHPTDYLEPLSHKSAMARWL
jgi:hypothetical protein